MFASCFFLTLSCFPLYCIPFSTTASVTIYGTCIMASVQDYATVNINSWQDLVTALLAEALFMLLLTQNVTEHF